MIELLVVTVLLQERTPWFFMAKPCIPKKVFYWRIVAKVGSLYCRAAPLFALNVPKVNLAGTAVISPLLKKKARKVTHYQLIMVADREVKVKRSVIVSIRVTVSIKLNSFAVVAVVATKPVRQAKTL